MNVTVIPIVIRALGRVTKWLIKVLEDLEISGRVESREEYWKLEETYCHSKSSDKPSAITSVKKLSIEKVKKLTTRILPRSWKNTDYEGDSDCNSNSWARNRTQKLGKKTGRTEAQKESQDYTDYVIVNID